MLATLKKYNLEIAALSTHGNPVHPNREIARQFHEDFENAVMLAEKMHVDTVVTFSGCPGGCKDDKTPVMPNYLISETPRKVILRNFEGVITSYTQPEHYVQDCHCDVCTGKKKVEKTGVAWVAEGTKQRYLEPTKLLRNERHVKK